MPSQIFSCFQQLINNSVLRWRISWTKFWSYTWKSCMEQISSMYQWWNLALDLLDLTSRGVEVGWGQHDSPPAVTVPGLHCSFVQAQYTARYDSVGNVLPSCRRPYDRPSTFHSSTHDFFHLLSSLILSKPLHSSFSQFYLDRWLTQPLSYVFVPNKMVPSHSHDILQHSHFKCI